jgi:O-succinylbenzoic acid--CoA ligase
VLRPVPASAGPLTDALAAALEGGPAVLPVPFSGAERARLEALFRPDVPLEVPAAVVVPTSGSTGSPKGAMLPASALLHSARATLSALGGPGTWLLALPTTHIAGIQVLVRSLVGGVPPVSLDLSGGFSAEGFAAAASTVEGPRRYTALVPTQLVRLLSSGGAGLAALAQFDAVLVGGAATPPALLARARDAGVRVVTTYGMSETCGGCVYDGVPLSDVDVVVPGSGRLTIGGPVLFSGYRLRPDLTALALPQGRYVTNDLGSVSPDGRVTVFGRADDVIVSGGENIAPAAVEAALATLSGVREAAVVGVPDPEWGERVVAVIAGSASLAEVRDHVSASLGRRSAPSRLIVVDDLPRLALGKIDRMAVLRLASPESASGPAGATSTEED